MANLTITAANVAKGAGSNTRSGTAGAGITQGQPIYLDGTSKTLFPADADADRKSTRLNSSHTAQN